MSTVDIELVLFPVLISFFPVQLVANEAHYSNPAEYVKPQGKRALIVDLDLLIFRKTKRFMEPQKNT